MKAKYITIEREYGSGGTAAAHLLSSETGIPCYGREIVDEVSKTLSISGSELESCEETASNSLLYSIYMMAQAASANSDMLTREGHIFVAEQAVIKRLADAGRAIFLGHCAAKALEDRKGLVRVFIRCADGEKKKKRIIEEYGIPEADVERTRRHFDKKRAAYYAANTSCRWDSMQSYDVTLDSGVLGIEGCAAALKTLL